MRYEEQLYRAQSGVYEREQQRMKYVNDLPPMNVTEREYADPFFEQSQTSRPFTNATFNTNGSFQKNHMSDIDESQDTGILSRLVAAGAYSCFWISGLILFLFVPNNRLIRFHALQSLLFFGGATLLYSIVPFIYYNFWDGSDIQVVFFLFYLFILSLMIGAAWFFGILHGLRGRFTKLPFVGNLAAQIVGIDQNFVVPQHMTPIQNPYL